MRRSGLYYGKEAIRSYPAGFKLPQNRPWLNDVNDYFHRATAMGIIDKLNSDFTIPQQPRPDDVLEAITPTNLLSAFFFLIFGMAISGIVFIFELLFKKIK